ncbi:short-chain dehydrogenase [Haladaptatus sp. W1]|uniref:SDR family NAD(P)-dependent oxidoreductase n=1 Tax=Haladaptatus sp. W1 TaxID=1897478 RepID=UPI000849B038|nr:SDR family NAD(P)-dependent oxidoreductase [Haladaptatus sp. W1]ODR80798.1 short-chain dehydrogenase [Haladaptatus sp. W1]
MNIDLYDSLDGQVALVTGANRGIGEAIAARLTELGATVYAGARDPDAVTAPDQRAVRLDVTEEATIRDAVGTIADEAGRLDVLVNNAATYGPTGKLDSLDSETIETTLRTNLHGPMLVTKHALSLLTDRDGARVVTLSSGSGQFDGGIDTGHLPYGVSKAGVNAFTDALSTQYPNLLVNAVCPGWVRTDMGGSGAPRSVEKGAETPVWLARFEPGNPSGKLWRDRSVIEW